MIELFGLPGCGKSTLCKNIEKNGYEDLLYKYKNRFLYKLIFHASTKFTFLFPNVYNNFKYIKQLFFENQVNIKEYKNMYIKKTSLILYIKYLSFIYTMEQKYDNKKVIIDEGIVHYCMALYSEFDIPLDSLKKICFELLGDKTIIPVGLKISLDQCFYRIKKRNRRNTGIDYLNDNKLSKLILRYEKAFNYFSKFFVCKNHDNLLKYLEDVQ